MAAEAPKTVDVLPQEETVAPAVAPGVEPVVEAPKPEETPAVEPVAPVVEAPATTETTEAVATEAPKAEDIKEDVKPVEEGHLEHKKGTSFPKNLLWGKQFFWFGTEPVEHKNLSHYLKSEKSHETAHHNASWASKTGEGLLFHGEKKDAPAGIINLADATEPEVDGANRFHFSSKGLKHVFKAANTADRDNWVAQLKVKIAEAKEKATHVTDSEEYKSALEALKPKSAKKEEKKVEAAAVTPATEEVAKPEETVVEPEVVAPVAESSVATEEAKKDEIKEEKPKEEKARSSSRKRLSVFAQFGKKGKKEEAKAGETSPIATEAPVEAAPATETPAVEAPVETAVVEPATSTEAAAEEKPAETKESPRPTPSKRASIFNVFGKKEKAATASPEPTPTTETAPIEAAPVADSAPVIPPVEATTPLAAEVASPATVPTETVEPTAAAPVERPEVLKTEKRKSSLPFFGNKKEKTPTTEEPTSEKEKAKDNGLFARVRNTIKGRPADKVEKPAETSEEAKAEEKTEDKTEEAVVAPAAEPSVAAQEEELPKSDVPAAPVVTAAA